MNLPNKLTLMRIILVPFFVAALLIPFPLHNLTALIIFAAASITDLLDGKIARVLLREFSVTSVRLIAASKGKVIAANIWGKVKTVTQMVAVIGIIALQILADMRGFGLKLPDNFDGIIYIINETLIWISTFFAVLSGVIYLKQNSEFISDI